MEVFKRDLRKRPQKLWSIRNGQNMPKDLSSTPCGQIVNYTKIYATYLILTSQFRPRSTLSLIEINGLYRNHTKAILLATGLFVYCCILVKCADIKRCLRGDCSEEDEDDDEKSLAWKNKQTSCHELSVFNSAKDAKVQPWLMCNESPRMVHTGCSFIHSLFFFNIWFLSLCDPSNL